MNSISDRWVKWPGIILFLYALVRVIDYGKIILFHPLSNIKHDIYGYLPFLYFLKECGFHQWCPYWYNGFTTFVAMPPGWFFFTYPLYALTNNVRFSTYLSLVIVYVLMMLTIWWFGKRMNMSKFQRLAFFAFFVGNNVMINTLRLGKVHELFAWLFLIMGFFMMYYYKDRQLTNKIYWIIIPYTLAILSYHGIAMLLSLFIVGLIVVNPRKNFLKLLSAAGISFALSSFWWVYLLTHFSQTSIISNNVGVEAWWMFQEFYHFTSIGVIIIPLLTFAAFYLYYRTNHEIKNIMFFGPALVVVALFLIGVLPFFPIVNHIQTNMYFALMIFLTTVFLFSTKYDKLPPVVNRVIPTLLLIGAIATITISLINTPFFDQPTNEQKDLAEVLRSVNGTFLVTGDLSLIDSHRSALYSYGVVELGLKTASGHYPAEKDVPYIKGVLALSKSINDEECEDFLSSSRQYQVTDYVSYGKDCIKLANCHLFLIASSGDACLYRV